MSARISGHSYALLAVAYSQFIYLFNLNLLNFIFLCNNLIQFLVLAHNCLLLLNVYVLLVL